MKLFINRTGGRKVGFMVPIPQYPLYSATIEEFGLGQVHNLYTLLSSLYNCIIVVNNFEGWILPQRGEQMGVG